MTHDCSTLGGNSGSAVIDVNSGDVVALHFAGEYLKQNYAVPMADLAEDSEVTDAGVETEHGPTPDQLPVGWHHAEVGSGGVKGGNIDGLCYTAADHSVDLARPSNQSHLAGAKPM